MTAGIFGDHPAFGYFSGSALLGSPSTANIGSIRYKEPFVSSTGSVMLPEPAPLRWISPHRVVKRHGDPF